MRNICEGIGARIELACYEANLTQRELAQRMGSQQSCISDWVRGKKIPTLVSLQRIADALGIDPLDLIDPDRP